MAIDYMDDGGGEMTEQPSEAPASEERGEYKTALVNSEIAPGLKPGDVFPARVERVLDSGEYEICRDDTKADEPVEPEPSTESEMDAYMA